MSEPKPPGKKSAQPGVQYDDHMSVNDALMWHIERDPILRSTVLSVWILDCVPDAERFTKMVHRTERIVPRSYLSGLYERG
ncbi:MAG: hypothetical protein ACI8TX_001882 [Hyphomicrobiaceae bacterium]|jgi:hypothetical protein